MKRMIRILWALPFMLIVSMAVSQESDISSEIESYGADLPEEVEIAAELTDVGTFDRCGRDPARFLNQHLFSGDGRDVHTMRNLSGNPRGCRLYVTFDAEHWSYENKEYEHIAVGRICLDSAERQNVWTAPVVKLSRLTNVVVICWLTC